MHRPPAERSHFTVADAARFCGLTEALIRARIQKGSLPVERSGRTVLISREALDRLVCERY